MRKFILLGICAGTALLLIYAEMVIAGRGRGGGGGSRGGGASAGAARAGGGGAVNAHAAGSTAARSAPPVGARTSAPSAGARSVSPPTQKSGSITTKGGSTVTYKGAGVSGTGPGGADRGRYAGGVQVTTPGGATVSKVGGGKAVSGPGGNTAASRSGVTVGTGSQGSMASRYGGGVAVGAGGAVASGGRVGVATGPGGTVTGATRGTVATGPYGAAAGRNTVVSGAGGTYYRSAGAISGQGAYVRTGVAGYPCCQQGWYRQYPGAWRAAGWATAAVWGAATWGGYSSSTGTSGEPAYYDYGENVTYQEDGVYVDGEKTATAEEYAQQATELAEAGQQAKATKEEEWLPLGIFAMVQGEEKTSNHIFQLAVNKENVIRGNYYDAVTDTTALVSGSVDKKTQRAAWMVGDRKTPIYEAGVANLTKNETTMMVHYGKDRSQQFTLIRVEEPPAEAEKEKAK